MSTRLRFREPVLRAGHYLPPWSGVDRSGLIRLDRNESTQPLPPHAVEALVARVTREGVHTYPDAEPLRELLGRYCGLPADHILPTNGSDQGIDLVLRSFLAEGGSLLVARPEFPMFTQIADVLGVRILGVPYGPAFEFPYEAFWEAAARRRPGIIVVINPNNPTGTPVDTGFIQELAEAHPDVPVLVDEAYYEFTGRTVASLLRTHGNLIVLRTFSKAFAMAGLRLGYLAADPEVIHQVSKLRLPYDVNTAAIVAAEAQLREVEQVRRYVATLMGEVKPAVVGFLEQHGVEHWPGAANFVLVRPERCAEAVAYLREAGILVRAMHGERLEGTFRMSMGSPEEMRFVMEAYAAYLAGRPVPRREAAAQP